MMRLVLAFAVCIPSAVAAPPSRLISARGGMGEAEIQPASVVVPSFSADVVEEREAVHHRTVQHSSQLSRAARQEENKGTIECKVTSLQDTLEKGTVRWCITQANLCGLAAAYKPVNTTTCKCNGKVGSTDNGGPDCSTEYRGRHYCYTDVGACSDGLSTTQAANSEWSLDACGGAPPVPLETCAEIELATSTIMFDLHDKGKNTTIPTIKVLSDLPPIAIPMMIDGRSSTSASSGGGSTGVGVVLNGSAIAAGDDGYGIGLWLQADDVEVRGIAVVGFPSNGIYITGKRATLRGMEVMDSGQNGVYLSASASNASVVGGGKGIGNTNGGGGGVIVIGGNTLDGIQCHAPRLTIKGNVNLGVSAGSSAGEADDVDVGNGRFGLFLSSNAEGSSVGQNTTTSAVVIGWNGDDGINSKAAHVIVGSNVYVGVTADGVAVVNNRGGFPVSFTVTSTKDDGDGDDGTLRWAITKANSEACTRLVDDTLLDVTNALTVSGACQSQVNGVYVYQGLTLDGKAYYKNRRASYIYYDQDCDGADGSNAAPRWIMTGKIPNTTASADLDGDGTCLRWASTDSTSNTVPYGDNVWNMYCDGSWTGVYVRIVHVISTSCVPATITFDLPVVPSDYDGTQNQTIPTIQILSDLPSIAIPMMIDGRSSTSASSGGGSTGVGVVLNGSAVAAGDDGYGIGLWLQADDVEVRGIAVVGFPSNGIYIAGKRATLRSVEVMDSGQNGIYLSASASNASVVGGGVGDGNSFGGDNDVIVIGRNTLDGIQCHAPRLTIKGNVNVGVSAGSSRKANVNVGNGRFGIFLSSNANGSLVGDNTTTSIVVIGWNGDDGINSKAAHMVVGSNVYVGVTANGVAVVNNRGGFPVTVTSTKDDVDGEDGTLRWAMNKANAQKACTRLADDTLLDVTNELTVSGVCANPFFANQRHANGVYVYQGLTLDGKAYYKKDSRHYIYYDQDCDGADGSIGVPSWIMTGENPSTTASADLDGDGTCLRWASIRSISNTVPYGDNVWNMYCDGSWTDVYVRIVHVISTSCVPATITFDLPVVPSDYDGTQNQTIPTIQILSDLPSITIPMTIDGRSSSGIGVGVVLDGGSVVTSDENGAGNGLWLVADDVEVRGLAIVGFPHSGILIYGERAKIKDGIFAKNGENGIYLARSAQDTIIGSRGEGVTVLAGNTGDGIYCKAQRLVVTGNMQIGRERDSGGVFTGNGKNGIYLSASASNATVIGSDGGEGDVIVIGGNTLDGIQCHAPRLTITGNVNLGVSAGSSAGEADDVDVGNGRFGLFLSSNAEGSSVGENTTTSAVVIGWNGDDGINSKAAHVIVGSNVYVGVTADGVAVVNNRGGFPVSFTVTSTKDDGDGDDGTLRWAITKANSEACTRLVDDTLLDVTNALTVSGACQSQVNGVYVYQGLTLDGKAYYKKDSRHYIYYDQDCDGADGSNGAPRWIIDGDNPSTTASADLDGDGTCREWASIGSTSNTVPYGDNVWNMYCDDSWTSRVVKIVHIISTSCIPAVTATIAFDLVVPTVPSGNSDTPNQTIPTIHILSDLPSIAIPMMIDGRSSTSASSGGGSTGVGVVLNGSAVGADDGNGYGLWLQANDVEVRGIAVVGFPSNGIYITGKRATIRGGEITDNGRLGNEDTNGVGIHVADSASDATIGGVGEDGTADADAIVIGGNAGDGISGLAPRLTIAGTVYVGVDLEGNVVANGRSGILLYGADALIDGGASRRSNSSSINAIHNISTSNAGNTNTASVSAIVVGGNAKVGIECVAPRLTITGTVYVGVTLAGDVVANLQGIYLSNAAVDANIYGGVSRSGRSGSIGSSNTISNNTARINANSGSAIVVGGNTAFGIYCAAPRLTMTGNVFVGLTPQGQARGNGQCGIQLTDTAANARIGSSIFLSAPSPKTPTTTTTTTTAAAASSATTTTTITTTTRIYIGANAEHGISCAAPGLAVANTWIGLPPPFPPQTYDNSASATTTTTTTTITTTTTTTANLQTPPSSFGNGGDGIHLGSTAIDARIGSTSFDECSASNGYMLCTTGRCCEGAQQRFAEGTLDFVNTTNADECELAARYLQLQETAVGSGIGNYGDLRPFGCQLSGGSLLFNTAGDKSEPCGKSWRNNAGNCSTANPTDTPIFKCKSSSSSSSNDDGAAAASPTHPHQPGPPVRISSNAGAGIRCAAPRLAIANTVIGLGPFGEYVYSHGQAQFGNRGAAGVVLDESATDCRIGIDIEGWRSTITTTTTTTTTPTPAIIPTVFISGNARNGIQAAAPNLRVVKTAVGLEARSTDAAARNADHDHDGASAAPNNGAAGIKLLKTATNCRVGTYTNNPKIKTWIAGNKGDGISASGVSVKISATDVGFNQQGTHVGNKRYGVLVEGADSNRHRPTFYLNTTVGASGYCGVRVGFNCNDASATGAQTVYALANAADSAASANTNTDIMNGQLRSACKRCMCSNTTVAELLEVVVDCSAASTTSTDSSTSTEPKLFEPPANFGRDFFSSIPKNTVSLLMPSAKVVWVNWTMLAAAASNTLRVLDLSGNNLLENPFPPPSISFPKLTTLNLCGANLKSLASTSVQDMCSTGVTIDNAVTENGFALQSLDLSAADNETLQRVANTLTVSAACASTINGGYVRQGRTKDGKNYYKGGQNDDRYIYYDKDCNGDNFGTLAVWVIGIWAPNVTAASDLDGDGKCTFAAYIQSSSITVPDGANTWTMPCDDKVMDVNLQITIDTEYINGDDLNLTGFTNLAAFAWHNTTTCPPGFYSTTDSPSNRFNVLCGRCPSGTEKLDSGGTRDDCTTCPADLFDSDNDASTPCEPSEFKVVEFKHYIPPSKDEAKYAFSETNNDPRNNDPLRSGIISSLNEQQQPLPYFGIRTVSTIDDTTTANTTAGAAATSTSYQTLYADMPVILPPINATKTQSKSPGNVTFTVTGLTDDFFINPDNGAIFGNPSLPPPDNAAFNVTVYAVDSNGARAEVERIQFTVIRQDTNDTANGPGGERCTHGKSVDSVKFDGKFTCDCVDSGYEGANCSTSTTGKNARIIIVVIAGCILLGGVAWRFRQKQVAENDAKAALARARKAYGLSDNDLTIDQRAHDDSRNAAVNTITNPTFVGLTIIGSSDLESETDDGAVDDMYMQVAATDIDAAYMQVAATTTADATYMLVEATAPSNAASNGAGIADISVTGDASDIVKNSGGGSSDYSGGLISTFKSNLPAPSPTDDSDYSQGLVSSSPLPFAEGGHDDDKEEAEEEENPYDASLGPGTHGVLVLPSSSPTGAAAPPAKNKKEKRRRNQLSKFVAPIISLGKSTLAAKGLDVLLGIDPKTYMHVKNKVKVMLKEFAKNGTDEDNQNLKTLMDGTYKHPPNGDGSSFKPEDIIGQSKTIDELMACSEVQDAGLERHHVLALRVYTTSSYASINDPMRQSTPVLPHPFGATLYYISDALSKLRELQGRDAAMRNETLVFWRGMKDLQITDEFLQTGGSEMACMSTTSEQSVAEEFALSKSPLLFKFVSKSFMSHGADISFLSVYPGEKEWLYPPLTYLRPIKVSEETIGGKVYKIVEVEPVFPK